MNVKVLDAGLGVVHIGERGSASVEDEAVSRSGDEERGSGVVGAAQNSNESWGAEGNRSGDSGVEVDGNGSGSKIAHQRVGKRHSLASAQLSRSERRLGGGTRQ